MAAGALAGTTVRAAVGLGPKPLPETPKARAALALSKGTHGMPRASAAGGARQGARPDPDAAFAALAEALDRLAARTATGKTTAQAQIGAIKAITRHGRAWGSTGAARSPHPPCCALRGPAPHRDASRIRADGGGRDAAAGRCTVPTPDPQCGRSASGLPGAGKGGRRPLRRGA
jgi:hypothetical protein